MGRKADRSIYHPASLEEVATINKGLPNPFGTFEKAKYVIYGYAKVVFYSCVTTCRSEENMIELLMEFLEINLYMKEYYFVRIVKYQGSKEKVLFKGNVFKNDSISD